MTPRIATVLSTREWEPRLVSFIQQSAGARLVLRAFQPADIDERRAEFDVLIAGAETSWVSAAAVASWRRSGLRVIGVHPDFDHPAREILKAGGADEVLPESVRPEVVLATARALAAEAGGLAATRDGLLVAVTGARGAPGRTEVAIALSLELARRGSTLLADCDVEAPSIAVRLGLPPRPDLAQAADSARGEGRIADNDTQRWADIEVIVGTLMSGEPALRNALVEDVIAAAQASFDFVVADLGPGVPESTLVKRSDAAFLIARADPVGMVRAARLCEEWAGPPPALILNRVPSGRRAEVVAAARQWLGLDPIGLIFDDGRIAAAARSASLPPRQLTKQIGNVIVARP